MTVDQLRDVVDAFFSRSGGASLKLPSGWFGRPHDNFHELTSATVVDSTLVIVLDERLQLRLHGPQRANIDGGVLRLDGFKRADWKWYEYGTDAEHLERFDGGAVEFVAD